MKRTGFTLIELLVVIAVIAVLIGILVPVLNSSRKQTRAVVCGSNLKQLALTLTMYEQENGTFPPGLAYLTDGMVSPPGDYVGNRVYDRKGWWWFHFLADILEENFSKGTIPWCPSRNVKDPGLKANILCGNYGVNQAICKNTKGKKSSGFVGTPLTLNQIYHPAGTLLIVDSGYSLISWRAATNESGERFENSAREGAFYVPGLWINKQRFLEGTISPGYEQDAIKGRHPGKTINVGFADGHFARIKADDLFVEEVGDDNYSNLSPLWLPHK